MTEGSEAMVTAIFVPCDRSVPASIVEFGGFSDCQSLVADLVIPVDIEEAGVTMFVDAHDRYKGRPVNERVTAFRQRRDPSALWFPALHGDVLVVGDTGSLLSIADVPTSVVADLVGG